MLDKLKNPMFPWQPMDSAPKDGTQILLSDGDQMTNGEYTGKYWRHYHDGMCEPSEWMFLDTPEKLAAALKIAVEGLKTILTVYDMCGGADEEARVALKQIEEVLG